MSWDDMDAMQDEDYAWPDLAEAIAFRTQVAADVEALIRAMPHPKDKPVTMGDPYWALFLAFEHEKIHLETSSVLIRQLPLESVVAPAGWRTAPTAAPTPDAAPQNRLVPTQAATVVLGKPTTFPSFGWDNEYGKRVVEVPAFSASAYLVSNAEFLPFVTSGGYTQKTWWVSPDGDDEGWRWATFRNATHPSFWVAGSHPDMVKFHGGKPGWPYQKDDGVNGGDSPHFRLRVQFSIIDMPWDWPAEVCYHEAAAFLRWKGAADGVVYRMPTEAEYHVARGDPAPWPEATLTAGVAGGADGVTPALGAAYAGAVALPNGAFNEVEARAAAVGEAGPDAALRTDVVMQPTSPGNLNWRWHSPTPVHAFPPSSTGFHDTHGNVWEWAEDHFAPLPEFSIHYLYDDFSAPCFDGWHTVILGGSWVSSGNLASSYARYHFRRHFFQQLGFRYVAVKEKEAFPGAATVTNLWEGGAGVSHDLVNEYLVDGGEGVGGVKSLVPAYGPAMAALTKAAVAAFCTTVDSASSVALHLGCGVGGGTFYLARSTSDGGAGFGKVVAVDGDEGSIRAARLIQHHGQLDFERVTEGVLTESALARTPAAPSDRAKVQFVHADVTFLPPDVLSASRGGAGFDTVLVDGNLLCRLTQPLALVSTLSSLVRSGGLLVVSSANDWDPTITPRNSWLGGFKMNGEKRPTLDMLGYHLKRSFKGVAVTDVPRMRGVSDRGCTLEVMQVSAWVRL